jgi:hypothetical protein
MSYRTVANNLKYICGSMVMSATGAYSGCYPVLLMYRVAVDCRLGDLSLMDTQEIHGHRHGAETTP